MNNNDLISRAAAIDAIVSATAFPDADYIKNLCQNPANSEDWLGGVCDAINAVEEVNAVDAAPVVQRWISVKDRLPEVAGWYIVFYNESAMQVAYFKGKKWPFNNHYHTITHWMPLPEPPKMDGEANG